MAEVQSRAPEARRLVEAAVAREQVLQVSGRGMQADAASAGEGERECEKEDGERAWSKHEGGRWR